MLFLCILIQASGHPLQRSPIYGKPTPDDQVLVDETASAARPLVTEYVSSPQLNKTGGLLRGIHWIATSFLLNIIVHGSKNQKW